MSLLKLILSFLNSDSNNEYKAETHIFKGKTGAYWKLGSNKSGRKGKTLWYKSHKK